LSRKKLTVFNWFITFLFYPIIDGTFQFVRLKDAAAVLFGRSVAASFKLLFVSSTLLYYHKCLPAFLNLMTSVDVRNYKDKLPLSLP